MSAMIPGVLALVYALAVARVTRLITADRLTEVPRDWLVTRLSRRAYWKANRVQLGEKYPGAKAQNTLRQHADFRADMARADGAELPLSAYLLTCPWCASVYVGAAAAPLAYFWGSSPWLFVPALALAFSHFTGLASKGE